MPYDYTYERERRTTYTFGYPVEIPPRRRDRDDSYYTSRSTTTRIVDHDDRTPRVKKICRETFGRSRRPSRRRSHREDRVVEYVETTRYPRHSYQYVDVIDVSPSWDF